MKISNILHSYWNGNYSVVVLNDGTKIRTTKATEFIPDFAENCDVKITDKCDGGCPFCYEGCTPKGEHAILFDENNKPIQKWLTELHQGTELALNGNDLSHPDLQKLLEYLKSKGIITNITVNQKHFMQKADILKKWCDDKLIYGLGVSLSDSADEKFYETLKDFPNAVIHTIVGILSYTDFYQMRNRGLKILILGYKDLGRGTDYKKIAKDKLTYNIHWMKSEGLKEIMSSFKVVSFDNLALEQLDVKKVLFEHREKGWKQFYMGDDGQFTFYIDAVKQQYAKDSCVPVNERKSSTGLTVDQMFSDIRKYSNI